MNACPKNAITMKSDDLGFIFPQIDEALCIDCALCKSVCSFQNDSVLSEPKAVFAGKTKITDIKKSASGGIFACIASILIEEGAAVYGAALVKSENGLTPKHIKAQSKEELKALLGSKYVQSDTQSAFVQVKADLNSGKTVLFSGTPCQTDGLKGYLGKAYEKLYCIDVICHGVPAAQLFSDYQNSLKHGSEIKGYAFRSKEFSGEMISRISFENGKEKLIPCNASSYFYLFINGYTYRESCYSCKYAQKGRSGDITLGDFWGIEKFHPEFNSKDGVSCILINTDKGRALFEKCKSSIDCIESDFEKVAENNAQLKHPSIKPEKRDALFVLYKENGYSAVEKAYKKLSKTARYTSGAKLIVKRLLKR